MTEAEAEAVILAFPGAERGTSYGHPSFKINGKFFTRIRAEDASLVISDVAIDEREMLMEAEPETFHITAHYMSYGYVLARIATLHPGSMRNFLARRFRRIAKKAVVRAWEAEQGDSAAARP